MTLKQHNLRGASLLLLTSMIWGAAFVAQSAGVEYVGPFTLNGIRLALAGLVLLAAVPLLDRLRGLPRGGWRSGGAALWKGGILCGVALFAATSLQQIGLMSTQAGKAGFITALYVVLVPLCGLALGKRPGALVWLGVALAAVGLYLLCIKGSLSLERGDAFVLLGAFGFTAHILLIDHFSPLVDGIRMSCIQFLVAGALGLVCMAALETPTAAGLRAAALPILYAGVLSGGVAYTLQIVAQKDTDPTVASLILCLESVFAVLFGWLLLGERLSAREGAGCVLMFAAIVLAQSGSWPRRSGAKTQGKL